MPRHLRPLRLRDSRSFRSPLRSVLRGSPATTTSADFSLRRRAASPFQARGEISPGKNTALHRTTAGFTSPEPWPSELRGPVPARPARRRLVSGSCSSARGFAPRFLPTVGRPSAVAVRFDQDGLLSAGLAPARSRPCWAHQPRCPPPIWSVGIVVLAAIVNLDDAAITVMAISLVSCVVHVDDVHRPERTRRHQAAWAVTAARSNVARR